MADRAYPFEHYRALADAAEVEMQALDLLMRAVKRRRDAYRRLEEQFTPQEMKFTTPLPVIAPPFPTGPDPDFDDPPTGDQP